MVCKSLIATLLLLQASFVFGSPQESNQESQWIEGWWMIDQVATYEANKEGADENTQRLMHNLGVYVLGFEPDNIEMFMMIPATGTWKLNEGENEGEYGLAITNQGNEMKINIRDRTETGFVMNPGTPDLPIVMKKINATRDEEKVASVCEELKGKWVADAERSFEVSQARGLTPTKEQVEKMFGSLEFTYTGEALEIEIGGKVVNEIQWVPTVCATENAGEENESIFLVGNTELGGRQQPLTWHIHGTQSTFTLNGMPVVFEKSD